LDRAAKNEGSQVALARALGIDPTRISRLMKGRGDYARLNFENCLRLAAILGEAPARVLRAAGHAEQAVLVERLCGVPSDEGSLKSSEWELLQMWRALPAQRQAALLTLLRTEEEPAAPQAAVRRGFPRSAGRRTGT
jgi:hypothetical protein